MPNTRACLVWGGPALYDVIGDVFAHLPLCRPRAPLLSYGPLAEPGIPLVSILEEQAFVVHAGLPLDPKVPCDIYTCVRLSLYLILNVGGR